MAKAAAYLRGRDYVVPQDVLFVYPKTVEHRLLLAPEARTPDAGTAVLKQIAARIPAPRV